MSIGIERICHFFTDGFTIDRILSYRTITPIMPNCDCNPYHVALNQPYRYLASGSQSFVFLSNDQRYVLKFFKQHRWRIPLWFDLPLPRRYKESVIRRTIESKTNTFASCLLSYRKFVNETGLLYIHLHQTCGQLGQIQIVDRNGIKHKIALDHFEFIVQKKAEPIDIYLRNLQKSQDDRKILKLFEDYLDFSENRAFLGYLNKDPSLIKNYGILDNRLVEIDTGGCYVDPNKGLHYFYFAQLKKIDEKLQRFLQKEMPSMAPIFHNLVRTRQKSYLRSCKKKILSSQSLHASSALART